MRLTNNNVKCYLMDCLGYDELMIEELKENGLLINQLSEEEKKDCINYCM